MVVENLDTTTLQVWLLGPNWFDAPILHTWVLAILLPLLALAAVGLIYKLRSGPTETSDRAAGIVGSMVGVLVAAAIALFLTWRVGAAMGKGMNTTAFVDLLFSRMNSALTRFLGEGWTDGVFFQWILIVVCLVGVFYAIGWLVAALRSGPGAATVKSGRVLIQMSVDLARTSPRRIFALAWLAFRESIRRRVVVVFIVFVMLLLFAGWFINPSSDQPARLYIEVVLTATIYLTLVFALILSTLSLPADIKDRTLHTIVTKPVRTSEIVVGRILGFAVIGTVLLLFMGVASYVFTVRGINHTHELTAADLHETPMPGKKQSIWKGLTSRSHGHQHEVTIDPSGAAEVAQKQGHTHELTITGSGEKAIYKLGPPQGLLVARVPVYGKLRFQDRTGKPVERGINVGDEWTYRSFIEGQSAASAIWTFDDMTESRFPEALFPDGISVEMTIEVFRSHKGDMEKPILGVLWVRNPETNEKVSVRNFFAKKFATDVESIPRTIVSNETGRTVDLFRDMVSSDGRLEIGVQCLERTQYFGMAQPDLYIRMHDDPFALNFFKGYAGIWMQMLIVVSFGVMFSTFLSGPVALIATSATVIVGLFADRIVELTKPIVGGGPFESFVRILRQDNMISELDPGMQKDVALLGDLVSRKVIWGLSTMLPDLSHFDYVNYVASGFNVGGALLAKCFLRAVAFVLPLAVAGYLFLRMREVAK